jgi:hypothetical protein
MPAMDWNWIRKLVPATMVDIPGYINTMDVGGVNCCTMLGGIIYGYTNSGFLIAVDAVTMTETLRVGPLAGESIKSLTTDGVDIFANTILNADGLNQSLVQYRTVDLVEIGRWDDAVREGYVFYEDSALIEAGKCYFALSDYIGGFGCIVKIDLATMTEDARWISPPGATWQLTRSLTMVGGFLFVQSGWASIHKIDPATMLFVATYTIPGGIGYVLRVGTDGVNLYGLEAGTRILRKINPATLANISFWDATADGYTDPGLPWGDITFDGTFLYVNLSIPNGPTWIVQVNPGTMTVTGFRARSLDLVAFDDQTYATFTDGVNVYGNGLFSPYTPVVQTDPAVIF